MMKKINISLVLLLLLTFSSNVPFHARENQQDSLAFKEIIYLRKTGNYDQAIKKLEPFTSNDSKNAFAHNLLGEIYMEAGGDNNIKNAEKSFKKALDIEPENPSYLINYGNLELVRGRFSSAEKYFSNVLSADRTLIKAHEGLLRVYFEQNDTGKIDEIENRVKKELLSDQTAPDIYFTLGKLYLSNRNFQKAEEVLRTLIREIPSYKKALLYMGDLYFEFSRYSTAAEYYMEGLQNLTDEEELEKRYNFAKEIFSETEKAAYDRLPVEEKGEFLRLFWKKKDPDLLTDKNERLIEHLKRVKFVKTVYTPNKYPSMDDRGKIYVKYGAPDSRYISASGSKGFSRGNESWVYNMIHKDLSFDFVDFGGVYKQVKDLKEAIILIPDKYRELRLSVDLKLLASIELYKERAHLDISYARLATDNVEEFLDKYYNFTVNREIAEIEAPPERFVPEYTFKTNLDITAATGQFLGENGKTRLELYLGIYLMEEDFEKQGIDYKTEYNAHYALVNKSYDKEQELRRQYTSTVPDVSFPENTIAKYQENFLSESGDRTVAIKIINLNSDRGGIFTIDLPLRNFSSSDLTLSDIQFSEDISPVEGKAPDIKNSLKIIPYPFNSIRIEQPVFIYYEIYNLVPDLSGRTYYKIEYKLRQRDKSVNLIDNIISDISTNKDRKDIRDRVIISEGDKSKTIKYLQVDFSSLEKGRSQLIIQVTDLNSGQTAQTIKDFDIR